MDEARLHRAQGAHMVVLLLCAYCFVPTECHFLPCTSTAMCLPSVLTMYLHGHVLLTKYLLCTSTAMRLLSVSVLTMYLHGDDTLPLERGDATRCVLEGGVVRLG
eukprot:scaffold18777_cov60-Phaeocystis_antarctica.AAC.1